MNNYGRLIPKGIGARFVIISIASLLVACGSSDESTTDSTPQIIYLLPMQVAIK